jgi:hypothetical protein
LNWFKRIQLPVAIFGFLLISGFLAFHVGVATEYAQHVKQQQTNQHAQTTQPRENRLYTFWEWTTHDPVAFYTSALALFTLVLSVSYLSPNKSQSRPDFHKGISVRSIGGARFSGFQTKWNRPWIEGHHFLP